MDINYSTIKFNKMWKKLKKDLNHYMKVGAYLVLLALPSLGFVGSLNKSGGENTLDPNEPVPWEVVGNPYSHLIETDGYWNTLSDSTQKKNRLEEYFSEYSWDHGDYIGWLCGDQVIQMQIDARGINKIDEFISNSSIPGKSNYYPEGNYSGKIPFYHVATTHINGEDHAVGGVLIGNDPLDFGDWYFINYGTLERIYPGDNFMDQNSPVSIGLTEYKQSGPFPANHGYIPNLIEWNLQNGNATLDDYREDILVLDNPNDDEVFIQPHDDLYVDAGGFDSDYIFNVTSLYQLGYTEVIPEVTTENTPLSPEIDYYYPQDTVYTGGENYSFKIKVVAKIESGGVINADSTEYWIHIDFTTDVEGENRPTKFKLYQNYPNPFNPSTTIEYSIPTVGSAYNAFRNVRIDVFSSLGKHIITLLNEQKPPGNYSVTFDSSELPSGVYYYNLQAGEFSEVKKMMLLK